jgi:hypothetical protein
MRSLLSRDWFPFVVLGVLYLAASGVAPSVELLMGLAR